MVAFHAKHDQVSQSFVLKELERHEEMSSKLCLLKNTGLRCHKLKRTDERIVRFTRLFSRTYLYR